MPLKKKSLIFTSNFKCRLHLLFPYITRDIRILGKIPKRVPPRWRHGCSSLAIVVCVSGSGLCDELTTCSHEYCRLWSGNCVRCGNLNSKAAYARVGVSPQRERERERQTENIVKREVVLYGTVFIPGRQLLHGHPGLWISEYQFEFLLWCVHYYIDNERTNWQMTHKKLDNTMHSPTFNYIKIIIIMWRSLV